MTIYDIPNEIYLLNLHKVVTCFCLFYDICKGLFVLFPCTTEHRAHLEYYWTLSTCVWVESRKLEEDRGRVREREKKEKKNRTTIMWERKMKIFSSNHTMYSWKFDLFPMLCACPRHEHFVSCLNGIYTFSLCAFICILCVDVAYRKCVPDAWWHNTCNHFHLRNSILRLPNYIPRAFVFLCFLWSSLAKRHIPSSSNQSLLIWETRFLSHCF